jgi:uncharacterized protein (DUF433 family)
MIQRASIIHSDPLILGGTPVFVGTRVPAQSLFDYLEGARRLTSSCVSFHRSRVSRQ